MNELSLKKPIVVSFAFHIIILTISIFFLKQSTTNPIVPLSYSVSLVGSEVILGVKNSSKEIKDSTTLENGSKSESVLVEKTSKVREGKNIGDERELYQNTRKEEMITERISAIEAKKRIEKIVKLRSFISLKGISDKQIKGSKVSTVKGGSTFTDYYSVIRREIWLQWVYPDTGQKNLEVIISIRIMKDGTVTDQKIEKSSGNPIFDKSALKATIKASPLPSPPYEMEVGIRFYP